MFAAMSDTIGTSEEIVCKIEVTKKAKLVILGGFETEVTSGKEVPKDSKFSLWLNVAKSIFKIINFLFLN